jgi:hypothetical protein
MAAMALEKTCVMFVIGETLLKRDFKKSPT